MKRFYPFLFLLASGCWGSHPESVRANAGALLEGAKYACQDGIRPGSAQAATLVRSAELNSLYLGAPDHPIRLDFRDPGQLAAKAGPIQAAAEADSKKEDASRGIGKLIGNLGSDTVYQLLLLLLGPTAAGLYLKLRSGSRVNEVLVDAVQDLREMAAQGEFSGVPGEQAKGMIGEAVASRADQKLIRHKLEVAVAKMKARRRAS